MVAVTAVALLLSISAVLQRQYHAMENMALASGSSISAFVASNAALPAVENAAAPEGERDWTPIQAFIAAASKDQSVRWMTMVDADGFIRGASDARLLGQHYRAPIGETVVSKGPDVTVTDIKLDNNRNGFRFVRPIIYAGRNFGVIEVSISKADLEAAAATSRDLMVALGGLILLVVAFLSFSMAKFMAQPLRRLRKALRDGAMGDLDFRLSHRRKDEFGELFNAFNLFADAVQGRIEASQRPGGRPQLLDATVIQPAPQAGDIRVAGEHGPAGTPFDPAWRRSAS
jgi:serine/threonine-protein kinase